MFGKSLCLLCVYMCVSLCVCLNGGGRGVWVSWLLYLPECLHLFASENIILSVLFQMSIDEGIVILLKYECKSSCDHKLSFACISVQKCVCVCHIFFPTESCKNWSGPGLKKA